ncbi:WD40 repeat domain-containing protein [Blastopirellula marina]|uniref:Uncharacterized protein n=1 Tax=Blastopirellula marina TaxID=124 RepID=A0A2S8GQE4_9BACT|nr:WD40 repeat domain-containing protein [Blastopirellula marina]PQO46650.1 hypothetical protein C5Y93_07395 [Blastopirellula marina]
MGASSLRRFLSPAIAISLFFSLASVGHADVAAAPPTAETLAEQAAAYAERTAPARIVFSRKLDLFDSDLVDWDLSADGTRLIAGEARQRLAMWDVSGEPRSIWTHKSSQLVQRDSIIKISHDGSQVLIASPQGEVVILDGASGKTLYTHRALTRPVKDAGFSTDGKRIYAVDDVGNSFVTSPTSDGEVDVAVGVEPNAKPTNVRLSVAGDRFWWKSMDVGKELKQWFAFDRRVVGPIQLRFPQHEIVVAGPKQWFVGYRGEYAIVTPTLEGGLLQVHAKYAEVIDSPMEAYFTSDGSYVWLRARLVLHVCEGKVGRRMGKIALPVELATSEFRCYPDANLICKSIPQGLELWKVEGEPAPSHETAIFAISKLLDEQRFDVIELVAKKWDGIADNFGNREHETPTSFLMQMMQAHQLPNETEAERNARYEKWIEENPENCQFMRILMGRIYLAAGYRARGGGFANTVTEQGWKDFYQNMAKMWKVIEPVYDQEEVLAEAYVSAVIAGKNLQWERAAVNEYLRKAFAKSPNYHRTFAEEAVARLPRWGGAPGDTGEFAEKLANKIGGDDGDIMYAQIGRHLINFVKFENLPTEVGFSQERMVRGMMLLSERQSDTYLWNQTLLLAARIEDEEAIESICQLLSDAKLQPSPEVWFGKYEQVDQLYAKSLGLTPEERSTLEGEWKRLRDMAMFRITVDREVRRQGALKMRQAKEKADAPME